MYTTKYTADYMVKKLLFQANMWPRTPFYNSFSCKILILNKGLNHLLITFETDLADLAYIGFNAAFNIILYLILVYYIIYL